MKVGVIYMGVYPPLKGASGGDRRVRGIIMGISENLNEKPVLIIPNWNNSQLKNLDSDYYEICYLGSKRKNFNIFSRFGFWLNTCFYLLRNNFNAVLLYHTSIDSLLLILILRLFRVKIVYEISDFNSFEHKGIYKLLSRLTESFIPKFADINIGISTFICNHLKQVAKKSIVLRLPILSDSRQFFYDDVEAQKFKRKYNIQNSSLVISYAGGTWKTEGLSLLIESFKDLIATDENLVLVLATKIIKNNDHHDDVELLLSDLSPDKYVLTGWISTDQIRGLYSASDILVLPQLDSDYNKAAFPTKLAEYVCMKKSIIVGDIGDVKIYFKSMYDSIILDKVSKDELVKSLKILISDSLLRDSLASKSFTISETHFNRKNACKKIIESL